ncbi:hypothetical protein SPRG_16626 [Saprolegnia parasitica CBS 223.65]|uniref:Uncharacterized protein n=1 Tax=Saprolegnia parasitica (strain CBS 223.65) TaxID=695850 RepID=A0A067BHU5_SAPPC|nr:hypothetical protein SPRG_16626 [Saprolegnia parasitica CBS 223.65]KDO17974.1 hypothetical protein SPRG_16626 [Saprolegnia parasitica CBS 223.65]|eukprot:XP_012211319.1 hypothetical protein SPRG_16626 [Saprolegnia parasitica CBS 223.65]
MPPASYECTRVLRGHVGPVIAVRFNDKGTYCMSCGNDRTIKLWNPHRDGLEGPESAFLVKSYTGLHGYEVRDVAIEHDNAKFVSCGRDKAIFQWDVATGKVVRKLDGHSHSVNAVEYNDDCSVVASASYDSTVRLWDMRSRNSFAPIQVLDHFKDSVTSVKMTDHEIITGCVDGYVRSYDLRAGLLTQDNLHSPVVSLQLSSDLNCIVASTLAKRVVLFEAASGTELNAFEGHALSSYGVECGFTFDDAHIISGSEDGRVLIWDMLHATDASRSFLAHGANTPVRSVVSHPTEDMLLTASIDSTVKVWRRSLY